MASSVRPVLTTTSVAPAPEPVAPPALSPSLSVRHHTKAYPVTRTDPLTLPLAQRYQPNQIENILLDRQRLTLLNKWINKRAAGGAAERAAILMGPPGSGKTSAARVLLRAAGFQVVEFGAGSLSTDRSLAQQVQQVIKHKPLPGVKPTAALIDDFDGLCAIDRDAESSPKQRGSSRGGAVGASAGADDGRGRNNIDSNDDNDDNQNGRARLGNLVGLIAEAKASWGPIVICCNDSGSAEVRVLRQVCLQVWTNAVTHGRLIHVAQSVARAQGHTLDDNEARTMADAACGDVRRLLNMLDMRLRIGSLLETHTTQMPPNGSDIFLGNFDAIEVLLTGRKSNGRGVTCDEATALYSADPLLRRAMVHHNYLRAAAAGCPAGVTPGQVGSTGGTHGCGQGTSDIDCLAAIAENFSIADSVDFGSGATGSVGLDSDGHNNNDGASGSTRRSGSQKRTGWAYGANPATSILWANSARALLPRPRTGAPRIEFCNPSSSDQFVYSDARAKRRQAMAVALPTMAVAGPREPLFIEFDHVRAAFVGVAGSAYANMDPSRQRAVMDRMLWAGVTSDALAALFDWQRLRYDQQDQIGRMRPPPPMPAPAVSSGPPPLFADLARRTQTGGAGHLSAARWRQSGSSLHGGSWASSRSKRKSPSSTDGLASSSRRLDKRQAISLSGSTPGYDGRAQLLPLSSSSSFSRPSSSSSSFSRSSWSNRAGANRQERGGARRYGARRGAPNRDRW
jgi:hypothetical protein